MATQAKTTTARSSRAEALQLARRQPPSSPLRRYYWSLADSLRDLEWGIYDDDSLPFGCHYGMEDFTTRPAFREAWGKEIGDGGSSIFQLADYLKSKLT